MILDDRQPPASHFTPGAGGMARVVAGLAAAGFCAGGAAAQEVAFSPAVTEACLGATAPESRAECVGRAADACMNAGDFGSTTVGMGMCLDGELRWWDARLEAVYGGLMARETAADKEMEAVGAHVPSKAAALRDMQRAWIGWRDAACAYERAQWGGGSGSGPATLECRMQLTGQQALALEARMAGI